MPTADEYEKMSASEKKKEDWMNSKWRPMMGWLYMAVCAFDFILFPILWSMLQAVTHTMPITQWQPLTLQGAGLFHIAMGAVLGIAALGRTQEKLAGANNGGASATAPTGFGAPAPTSSWAAPAPTSSFGGGSFGSAPKPTTPTPTSSWAAPAAPAVATSSTGKLMPVPQVDEPL